MKNIALALSLIFASCIEEQPPAAPVASAVMSFMGAQPLVATVALDGTTVTIMPGHECVEALDNLAMQTIAGTATFAPNVRQEIAVAVVSEKTCEDSLRAITAAIQKSKETPDAGH